MSLAPFLDQALGLHTAMKDLATWQVVLRAIVVSVSSFVMARLADQRVFARKNVFDIVLALILASMLSRAINGSAALTGTIAAGFAMVLLHRALGWVACRWPFFSRLVKGRDDILIEDGRIVPAALRRHHLSPEDLGEDLRLRASVDDIGRVRTARLERSGDVSVILRETPARER